MTEFVQVPIVEDKNPEVVVTELLVFVVVFGAVGLVAVHDAARIKSEKQGTLRKVFIGGSFESIKTRAGC